MQSKKNADLKNLSDEEIVKIILQDGKPNLFSILYERYHKKIMDKCNSLLKNNDLSQNFTQEILTKIYEKLGSFQGKSSFSSWVYSITYNYCIDYLRLTKNLHYPEYDRKNPLPEIIDVPEEDLTETQYARLMELLDKLHTEEKAMILMKYQDEMSIKEIASAMRLSESAVKMRLMRARTRLLYLYKKHYETQPL